MTATFKTKLWHFGLFALGSWLTMTSSAQATSSCSEEFQPFMGEMLKELPAYINRVNTRANNPHNSVLVAAKADFQPLPLPEQSAGLQSSQSDVQQVFFATLLRRLAGGEVVYQQEHHWLFMAPSDRGWEFIQLYSTLSPYPVASVNSPPRNSSEGSVATAIKAWLKNCHYQKTRSLP